MIRTDEIREEWLEPEAEPKRPFRRTMRLGALFALVLALGFAGGLTVGAAGGTRVLSNLPLIGDGLNATPDPSVDFTEFWKVYNTLNSKFVPSSASSTIPTNEEKLWGAIQGLAESFGDPYTVFLPPEEAQMFKDDISGNFNGVGMEIGINDDGVLTVIAPLKGTPAARAGILSGDILIAIDGKSTEGMSTDQAVKLIRGPKGTNVVFTIFRSGKTSEITVTRDTIQVPTIEYVNDPKTGVYTIELYEFTANSVTLFDQALADFRASGSKKLIIDLRGNPGGYLDAAVDISSRFLPRGEVVVTEDYKGKERNLVHRSTGNSGVPADTQIVVLINQGTASASEILAGALNDHERATLIGTRSFGKGSVQELITIGRAALKVTVARWLTPAGVSISDGGLTPDITAERSPEDFASGNDPQRQRAIEFLTTGK
ncbi:MAG TPA: S41 family peptidase [Candidatus Paceibacterota bacterium]|jgi:carboxyl-terminal processing protease